MAEGGVLLLAAGGHGRVVADALLQKGVRVDGVVDPGLMPGTFVFGLSVRGDDSWLDQCGTRDWWLANGAGSTPSGELRRRLFITRKSQGFSFISVLHPSATVGLETKLDEGCQIMAGAVLQCRVRMGDNSVVNTCASIDHDCTIGAHAFIGPGAILCGGVEVGEAAFVGAGAVLLPGIRIGARAVVGAGAVVTSDVDDGVWVVGNPATQFNAGKV